MRLSTRSMRNAVKRSAMRKPTPSSAKQMLPRLSFRTHSKLWQSEYCRRPGLAQEACVGLFVVEQTGQPGT